MPVPGSELHDLPGVGRPPQRAALGQEVAVLGVEEVDLDEAGRLAVDRRLVQRLPRLAAVGRAQQVARARGEERAAGAVDRVELGLRDVLALDGRERVPAVGGAAQAGGAGEDAPSRSSARSSSDGPRRRAGVERLPRGAAVVRAEQAARRVQRVADEGRREGDVDRRPRRSRRCRASTSCRRRSSWPASRCRPGRTPCPSGRRRARACRSRSGARRSGRSSAPRRRRPPWRRSRRPRRCASPRRSPRRRSGPARA